MDFPLLGVPFFFEGVDLAFFFPVGEISSDKPLFELGVDFPFFVRCLALAGDTLDDPKAPATLLFFLVFSFPLA